jgi:alpha-galactosidase
MRTIEMGAQSPASQIVTGDKARVGFTGTPTRYYHHGWQSWSLAAWVDTAQPLPVPQPYFLHPMHVDPLWAFHPRPHGSWVGAVEQPDGQILLLGSLGLDAHVELDGSALSGWYESGTGDWFIAHGPELQVFAGYADELRKRLGQGSHRALGGVWCSWYSLYTDIEERVLSRVFDGLDGLVFEVLQVDDGWQQSVGDWEANEKFPSGMAALAERIRKTGRRAGLWLAPLIAVKSSRLFRSHPGWFLRDMRGRFVSAGSNWGEQLYALDTTQPPVIEWLATLMRQVRAWGFDYLKLDFLYGAALPGKRHEHVPREAALRRALRVMREAMGPDAFLLGCGVPILPALGICDALRVGPDVWSEWESERDERLLRNYSIPGGRSAVRTSVNRLWLSPLVIPDPDVVYFRSRECGLTLEQKKTLQQLALICGFRATSDPAQWLSLGECEQLRDFLERDPRVQQLDARRFRIDGEEIDFSEAAKVRVHHGRWNTIQGAAVGWLANHRWALRLDELLRRRAAARRMRELRRGL